MSESLAMKAVFEALFPKGALWKLKSNGDFDKLVEGMGEGAQDVYDFLEALAWIRDPYKTTILSDLEKEYGVLTDTRLSEAKRRTQLAGIKYATPTTASYDHMQDNLIAAGFTDLIVTPNDPAVDPNALLRTAPNFLDGDMEETGYSAWIEGNSATLTKETGSPQAGVRNLKIEYNAVNNPYAYQEPLIIGEEYRIVGYAKGDATYIPSIRNGTGTVLWTGTVSASWQIFDVAFTAVDEQVTLYSDATGAGYVEFDSIQLFETTAYGELIINGTIYIEQDPAYLMQAGGDFAFAGNARAIAGYFLILDRTEVVYSIPDIFRLWRFIFFVGGAASGWTLTPEIDSVDVDYLLEESLKRLILKYKPMHSWCLLVANYVFLFSDGVFSNDSSRYITQDNEITGPFLPDVLATKVIDGHLYGQYEGERENLFDNSQKFEEWSMIRATVDPNVIADPRGNLTADKFVENVTASTSHLIFQGIPVDGSSQYVCGVFAKKAERSEIRITFSTTGFPTAGWVTFNLDTGKVIAVGGGIDSYNIKYITDGWYFCWAACTSNSVATANIIYYITVNGSTSYIGDGTSGIYLWEGKFEKGGFPSSIIETLDVPVVRDEDKFYWETAIVPEWLKKEKHYINWIPEASSSDTRDVQTIYRFNNIGGDIRLRLVLGTDDRLSISVYNGSWGIAVQTAPLVFNNKRKMKIILDPEEGSIEVIGAISGGDKVIDTSWEDYILDDAILFYGSNNGFIESAFALLTQPAIYREDE